MTPSKPRTAQQRIWLAAYVLKRFTIAELVATGGAKAAERGERPLTYDTTRSYVAALRSCGYVRRTNPQPRLGKAVAGTFVLAKRTGPVAPRVRPAGGLFDPNTNQVVEVITDGRE